MEKSQEVDAKSIKPLLLYNQFPRCYSDIQQMTDQLSQIALMGFNAVWLNPIQMVGQVAFKKFITTRKQYVKGSLYAMQDYQKIDEAFSVSKDSENINVAALKEYTKKARDLGLTPMFDLVLNHVATDSPLVKEHPNWFKTKSSFDMDVVNFNYSDPKITEEIIGFWERYIDHYVDLGFQGIRVDAVKHIPPYVQKALYQHLIEKCREKYGPHFNPVIFGEVFLFPKDDLERIVEKNTNLGITHTTNSLHWERFTDDWRNDSWWNQPWLKGENQREKPLERLNTLRNLSRYNQKQLGGTIGFSGCHDAFSLYDGTLNFLARSNVERSHGYAVTISDFDSKVTKELHRLQENVPPDLLIRLKERLAAIAFSSDSGWYLLSGDEFAHQGRKWVFDFYSANDHGNSYVNHWGSKIDLSPFILGINLVIKKLPTIQGRYNLQHIVIKNHPELVIVVRQNARSMPNIIVTNCSEKQIILGKELYDQIFSKVDQELFGYIGKDHILKNLICLGEIKVLDLKLDPGNILPVLKPIDSQSYVTEFKKL